MGALIDKNSLIGTCKILPFTVDADALKREIDSIPSELWGEHRARVHNDVNAVFVKGYPPIQNKPDDVRPILSQLPYFQEVIYKIIPGEPAKCVVADLKPGGQVTMHRDGYLHEPLHQDKTHFNYFNSTIRIHIPVVTSEQSLFFCNGEFFHMPAGEVWLVNNISDHAALNDSTEFRRVHIIVDMHPDDELLELVQNTKLAVGIKDRERLMRIMEVSYAPDESPYAKGKPLPLDYY